MKQTYEEFLIELEEKWTDENIMSVLDYMGIEYDYIAPINEEYHVDDKNLIKSDNEINKKTFGYKVEKHDKERNIKTKSILYNSTNNVAPMKLELKAA